jgi:hypothetical protein
MFYALYPHLTYLLTLPRTNLSSVTPSTSSWWPWPPLEYSSAAGGEGWDTNFPTEGRQNIACRCKFKPMKFSYWSPQNIPNGEIILKSLWEGTGTRREAELRGELQNGTILKRRRGRPVRTCNDGISDSSKAETSRIPNISIRELWVEVNCVFTENFIYMYI